MGCRFPALRGPLALPDGAGGRRAGAGHAGALAEAGAWREGYLLPLPFGLAGGGFGSSEGCIHRTLMIPVRVFST
ncbi:MAG TPA: hypothetical protein VFE78_34835 [Gemmataceae bacterium]|nr:hypothetical protein [Gemmataceae bacterium]